MNALTQLTENNTIPDNEALLKAWLRLSTSIMNNRLVSEMSYNESLVCSILYPNTKMGIAMTATELCGFTNMLKSQMNRTLNILEEKKLIFRQRSETDKRQVMISFNMEHAQAYENQHQNILKIVDHVICQLGIQETRQAISLFAKIADIADEILN